LLGISHAPNLYTSLPVLPIFTSPFIQLAAKAVMIESPIVRQLTSTQL
jgi:hypothetical protein